MSICTVPRLSGALSALPSSSVSTKVHLYKSHTHTHTHMHTLVVKKHYHHPQFDIYHMYSVKEMQLNLKDHKWKHACTYIKIPF